jgi:hypothetical protein
MPVMLGRKTYTQEELDHAKAAIGQQLRAYTKLSKAIDATADEAAKAALGEFEPLFLANLTLALDRYFVHRIRAVSGKDGNPLNEVELVTESVMENDSVLRGNNVIKLDPERSVLKLEIGDRISLSREQFERLSTAFLAEIEARFV